MHKSKIIYEKIKHNFSVRDKVSIIVKENCIDFSLNICDALNYSHLIMLGDITNPQSTGNYTTMHVFEVRTLSYLLHKRVKPNNAIISAKNQISPDCLNKYSAHQRTNIHAKHFLFKSEKVWRP